MESVQFTGSQIGINGDTTMIDLGATAGMVTVNGNLKTTGDLELSNAGAKIGISGDTNLMVLTSGVLTVDGKVASTTLETSGAATVGGDLTLSNTAAVAITHSGTTSLSISSGGYVAVESVQFADANIGISGDPNLMVLTSGTLTVDGKVASTTLETSGAATVGTTLDVAGATNLTSTLDVTGATTLGSAVELLFADAATVTHSVDGVSVDIEH